MCNTSDRVTFWNDLIEWVTSWILCGYPRTCLLKWKGYLTQVDRNLARDVVRYSDVV